MYCSDGICLGDDAAKVLKYPWEQARGIDFAAKVREAESAGQHCRPGRDLFGGRILPDGRRQVVWVAYRPGPSPMHVRRIETWYPALLNDQQRLEIPEKEKGRWPGLAGDVKGWDSKLHDRAAGVAFYLMRPQFDYVDRVVKERPMDGVVSTMELDTPFQTRRYMLASQSGCPPGIDWRN